MKTLLDSRQLHAFVMLSRTGSFTLAAKNLFLTPSAVSHALKELEQRVGCLLLDRRRKKVMLTQAGEHLLHHAERILQEMSDACTALELVRANKVDLAITVEPNDERELEFHLLFTDELAFFVAPGHPWAKAKQAIPAQISKQP